MFFDERLDHVPGLLWAAFRVGASSLLLPFQCLSSRKARHTIWRAKELHFGSEEPCIYPEIALTEIGGDHFQIEIVNFQTKSYNVTGAELLAIVILEKTTRANAVFEFGTADGRTTRNLALNLTGGGEVFTLNIPPELDTTHAHDVPVGSLFLNTSEEARIRQLWCDSRTFDPEPYRERCQLVFVDADHSEASVRTDSLNAISIVNKTCGIVIWHDALRYGVKAVLPQLAKELLLPVWLISGTNLAVLCFASGYPLTPAVWRKTIYGIDLGT